MANPLPRPIERPRAITRLACRWRAHRTLFRVAVGFLARPTVGAEAISTHAAPIPAKWRAAGKSWTVHRWASAVAKRPLAAAHLGGEIHSTQFLTHFFARKSFEFRLNATRQFRKEL